MAIEKRANGKYQVRVIENGRRISLGVFDSKSAARRAQISYRHNSQSHVDYDPAEPKVDRVQAPRSLQPTPKKPTLLQRIKNAFNNSRSNPS